MIECFGLTSMVFLETMYEVIRIVAKSLAFTIQSMLADQPYSKVVKTHGESEVSNEVSKSNQSKSLTVLSLLSAVVFFFNSVLWVDLHGLLGDHV